MQHPLLTLLLLSAALTGIAGAAASAASTSAEEAANGSAHASPTEAVSGSVATAASTTPAAAASSAEYRGIGTSPWLGANEVSSLISLIGAVATTLFGHLVLAPVGHKPCLLYCSLASVLEGPQFGRFAPPLQWSCVLLLLAPPFLLGYAAWLVAEVHWRVAALGCPVAAALYAFSFGILRLKADSFLWSGMAAAGLGGAALCLAAFFACFVCLVGPFTFVGASMTMLCLSAVPSIAAAYSQLPWSSTASVLALLHGEEAGAPLIAALQERRGRLVVGSWLAASVGTLVAYSVIVLRLEPEVSVRFVGFVVAAGVAVLDAMVWRLWHLGLVSGPLQTSALMVAARVAACVWGEHMWLLGHSGVVLTAGVLLSHIVVDCWMPRPDSPELRRQACAEQVLSMLESKLAARAAGPSGAATTGIAGEQPGPGCKPNRPRVECHQHPGWVFVTLVLAFSIEVGITWIPAVSPSLRLRNVRVCSTCATRPQNYYGVAAILAVLVYASTLAVLRRAQWQVVRSGGGPLLAVAWRTLLPAYALWLGLAAFVSYVTDVWAVLVHAGFLPSMLCLFHGAFKVWVAADFKLLPCGPTKVVPISGDSVGQVVEEGHGGGAADSRAAHTSQAVEDSAGRGCCHAATARLALGWRAVPWSVRAWAAEFLLLCLYTAALQATFAEENWWVAWTVGAAFVVLTASFLSNQAWFGTFRFNAWQWGAWLLVGLVLVTWAVGVWQLQGRGEIDHFALALLLVVLLYPACYSMLLACQMLWDAGLAPKDQTTQKFVRGAFGLSGFLVAAFLGTLVALGFLAEALCGVCLVGIAMACGGMAWKWKKGRGFLPPHVRRLATMAFVLWVLLAAVAVAVVREAIFGGFTVACAGAALLLGGAAWLEHSKVRGLPALQRLRVPSDCFFPAFRVGLGGELRSAHHEVVAVLSLLQTAALWGLVAAAALQEAPYVGAVVAVLALTASFVLLCHLASEGGASRTVLRGLPAASLVGPVGEALAAEGSAIAGSKVGSSSSMAPGGPMAQGDSTAPSGPPGVQVGAELAGSAGAIAASPEPEAAQHRRLQQTLHGLLLRLTEAQLAYTAAQQEAGAGRFHPLPPVSLIHVVSALIARCRSSRTACITDTSPGHPHEAHRRLASQAGAVAAAVQRRRCFFARLQLCLLAAEAQRRWTREAEFHAFLASIGGTAGKLSPQDLEHLPRRERDRLEEAWGRWQEAQAERQRLDEQRRREEEEAARRRQEAQDQVHAAWRRALEVAVSAGEEPPLRAALREASAAGLLDSDPSVVGARQALASFAEAARLLEQAVAMGESATLEEALLRAQVAGLQGGAVQEASARLAQLRAEEERVRAQRAGQRAEAQRELQRAMGTGNPEQLLAALTAAEAAQVPELAEARACLEQLAAGRQALREAVESGEAEGLKAALAGAEALGLVAEELREAAAALAELERRRQQEARESEQREQEKQGARQALQVALGSGSIGELELALKRAAEASLPECDVFECRGLVGRLRKIQQDLESAISGWGLSPGRQLSALERQLAAARSAQLQDPLVARAEVRLGELREAQAAAQRAEEEQRRQHEKEERRRQIEEEMRQKREEEEAGRRRREAEARAAGQVPIQKLDVEELLRSVPLGECYTDPDFTPVKALEKKGHRWQRLPDFLADPQLVEEGILPDDVRQGALGDCWLLSAMACCAAVPGLLDSVFVYADVLKGLYVVRLYHCGAFREIAVDDLFPTQDNQQSFAKSKTSRNEVWVSVLEKAYAKIHGSYEAIEGGRVDEGCVDLTGGIGDVVRLQTAEGKQAINDGSLWAKIKGLSDDGHMLGCGSHAGSDANVSEKGIVQGHAYSVLRVVEVDGHQLLQLRNPWGSTEWKGRWSDDDRASWTQRMRKKLDFRDEDDGTFWMAFEDFVNHYSALYICRILGSGWQRRHVHSSWRGNTAGGCSNYPTFERNPAFRLAVAGRVRLHLVVEQLGAHGARGRNGELFEIGVALYRAHGDSHRKMHFASSGNYVKRRAVCMEAEVEPGAGGPHYVVATTFEPGEEGDFGITAYWRGEPEEVSLYPEGPLTAAPPEARKQPRRG